MSEVKLPETFTITKDGEPFKIKLTYGLLNELVRSIGDIDAIADISFNVDLRDDILVQVFSERDEEGQIKKKPNLFNLDVEPDDVVDLLDWVGSHVADFLLKQMTRTKKIIDHNQPKILALMPTSTGSPA